jgi:hypothetical protein
MQHSQIEFVLKEFQDASLTMIYLVLLYYMYFILE